MSKDYDWTAYWLEIYVAAHEVQNEQGWTAGLRTVGAAGSGIIIGTLILPGVGTVLGAGIGLVASLSSNILLLRDQDSMNWWHILEMDCDTGRNYANDLYRHHRNFLSRNEIKKIMRRKWNVLDVN